MAKSLESFNIVRVSDGYALQIEDEDGETREFLATVDQLELIADEIERHFMIDDDEESPEPEEEEEDL